MQSATWLRAGADSRAESAQSGVYGTRTGYRVCRRYHLPPNQRGLALSGRGAGSVLAGSGWVVDGEPDAGGVGHPSVSDGDLSTAAHGGPHEAYRPWQPVGGRQLSAPPAAARDRAQYEPQGQLLG